MASNSKLENLSEITDNIRNSFEARTRARDHALERSRSMTRLSAHAIRAIHREEFDLASAKIAEAREIMRTLVGIRDTHPDIYFSGYTQDAVKEYVEANLTLALVRDEELPSPEDLMAEDAAYMRGMAEAATEMRRRALDILRRGYNDEVERLLQCMDDIYTELVTFDYPDAVTYGLRRQTDLVRGVLERTRGDLTLSLRQHHLTETMEKLLNRLDEIESE
ncbi:MAG: haloacid dehalogenase [Anaerolineaceae bacterium]|nr:haloacid dehalogenase [Anaerolineaceae bacterium]